MEDVIQREREKTPLFKAIKDTRQEETDLIVEFEEAVEPQLKEVAEDHTVACLLY